MPELNDYVNDERVLLEKMYSRAIEWLVKSEIRTRDGGYKSEYNPRAHVYGVWGGGSDCILNTAGSILVLLNHPSYRSLAIGSAEHLSKNVVRTQGSLHGSIPAGVGSEFIFPNYTCWSILAICQTYRATRREEFLDTAKLLTDWLLRNVQLADGKILDSVRIERSGLGQKLRDRINRSYSTWQAVLIIALKEIQELSLPMDSRYDIPIERLTSWVENAQREDGSVPFQYWSWTSRLYQAILKGRISLIRNGWDPNLHPTAAAICLQALLIHGERQRTQKLLEWLKNAIGPGGLFYQYYWNGKHSVEEDLMPTAYFSRMLLETNDSDAANYVIGTLKALARSQIASDDSNANGGFRGVPGHPMLGESAFCWDTEFALLLLQSILTMA